MFISVLYTGGLQINVNLFVDIHSNKKILKIVPL